MLTHTGPARCFDSEEQACEAIFAGKINPGDVVVIRYEGPAPRSGLCRINACAPSERGTRTGRGRGAVERHGRRRWRCLLYTSRCV